MKKQTEWAVVLLVIVALTFLVPAVGSGKFVNTNLAKQKVTQRSILVASEFIEMYADERFAYPGPTDGLVPLQKIRHLLSPLPEHLPIRDAWGHVLHYWSNGDNYMIVSFGADNDPEYAYEEGEVPYEAVVRGTLTQNPDQDIVLVCAEIWQGPVSPRARSRVTMGDMRSIATAVEEYAIDNNFYPGSGSVLVELVAIEDDLSPDYIRHLPLKDGWNQAYRYWSDRFNYTIISTGADGTADAPYEEWVKEDFVSFYGGEAVEPRLDLLHTNGEFVQWHVGIGLGDCRSVGR